MLAAGGSKAKPSEFEAAARMTPSKLALFNCLKDAAAGAASKNEKHFREWLKNQDPK